MMRLCGGPWNDRIIHDIGTTTQKMAIYSEFDKKRNPKPGCKCGYAIYEPNEERTHSYWLHNVWDGILEDTFKGKHFRYGE